MLHGVSSTSSHVMTTSCDKFSTVSAQSSKSEAAHRRLVSILFVYQQPFIGANATPRSVCSNPYVRLYACNISRMAEQISMKSNIGKFHENLSNHSNFGFDHTTIKGTLHEELGGESLGGEFLAGNFLSFAKVKGQILANMLINFRDITLCGSVHYFLLELC
jgi:hypothetical protein